MGADAANTAWLMVATALTQLMTPGTALFYGGLVAEGSVITILMQNFAAMGLITVLWYWFLFSLCYGETFGPLGNPFTYGFLAGVDSNEPLSRNGVVVVDGIPGALFVMYQLMFAVTTPALMTGTFADRFRFKPYLIFIACWSICVYAPWCHMVWGGGVLGQWGVVDFSGGLVCNTTAGFSALASLLIVGKRPAEEQEAKPHNLPFFALGTALLWFGYFGFTGGSSLASGSVAVASILNAQIAASVCMSTWVVMDWLRSGRPGLVGLCIGAIAGLACVSSSAGFIQCWGAVVIGLVGALICNTACMLVKQIGLDDALNVWGASGLGGFLGTVLCGALADPGICSRANPPSYCVNPGTVSRSWGQFVKQTLAACFCAVYSSLVTYLLLWLINVYVPIVPEQELVAHEGSLDVAEFGEEAYSANSPKRAKSGLALFS